jgi:hypothetical protein
MKDRRRPVFLDETPAERLMMLILSHCIAAGWGALGTAIFYRYVMECLK